MHSLDNKDNRHFHRILYTAEATLVCEEQTWHCEVIDLSLKGCLLRFDLPWKENPEKTYTLTLQLSEQARIKMMLTAMHVVDNQVGFKCEYIDIDSITELRRLVELNLGNSVLLERDLIALTGYGD